jgi:hypothetical protein
MRSGAVAMQVVWLLTVVSAFAIVRTRTPR